MPELEAPSDLARTANDIEASPLFQHGPLELIPVESRYHVKSLIKILGRIRSGESKYMHSSYQL